MDMLGLFLLSYSVICFSIKDDNDVSTQYINYLKLQFAYRIACLCILISAFFFMGNVLHFAAVLFMGAVVWIASSILSTDRFASSSYTFLAYIYVYIGIALLM